MLVSRIPSRFQETEEAAGEVRIVEDGVEAARRSVAGIFVAGRVEERDPVAQPVLIERQLHRRHLRVDIRAASRDLVEIVVAQHLIERVRDVQLAEVAVAGQPVIISANRMRRHQSDGRRPHQEIIGVVLERRIVFVVMEAGLNRVAGLDEILPVNIGDHHLLVAVGQGVQAAVGVLFQHREIRQVELIAVGIQVAEQPHARLLVGENEAAEIAGEGLHAHAQRRRSRTDCSGP